MKERRASTMVSPAPGKLYADIQAFKSSGAASENGLNYAGVVAPYLYDTSLKGALKLLVLSFFYGIRMTVVGAVMPSHLVFYASRAKERRDYDYIVDSIRSILGGRASYAEARDALSLRQCFRTLCGLPVGFRMARGLSTSMARRFVVGSLIARMRSVAPRVFASLPSGHRTLVTFCDAHAVENLVTQKEKLRGTATITNQHGQYRVLDARNMSADAEAYANFISDRMIVWGKATVGELGKVGVSSDRLSIAGWIRPRLQRQMAGGRKRVFGVMLNGQNAQDSNFALLAAATVIADALDLAYVVRLHPWTPLSTYRGVVDSRCQGLMHASLEEYSGLVDFSLAHMSGAVVELLIQRRAVYLMDDGKLAEVFQRPGLAWSSAQEIIEAVALDRRKPDDLARRIDSLADWYNDDSDQLSKLAQLLGR